MSGTGNELVPPSNEGLWVDAKERKQIYAIVSALLISSTALNQGVEFTIRKVFSEQSIISSTAGKTTYDNRYAEINRRLQIIEQQLDAIRLDLARNNSDDARYRSKDEERAGNILERLQEHRKIIEGILQREWDGHGKR